MRDGAIIPTAVPRASNTFYVPERNVVRRGSFGSRTRQLGCNDYVKWLFGGRTM